MPVLDLVREAVVWIGWQSLAAAVVFGVVAVVARCTAGARPGVVAALWGLVLVRLVLPLELASPFSLRAVLDRVVGSNDVASSEETVHRGIGPIGWFHGAGSGADTTPRNGSEPYFAVGFCWLLGAALMTGRAISAGAGVRGVLGRSREVTDPALLRVLEAGRRRIGVHREVRLYAAADRVAPFTVGVLRPVVVLPAEVVVRPDVAATVIAHELAHVQRLDVLWMAIERLLGIIYWFHPAVWIATARRHEARESACDALVLERGPLPARLYARHLLAVVRLGLQPVAAPATSVQRRRLEMRLRSILATDRSRRSPVAAAAVVVTAVALLPLASPGASSAAMVAAEPVTSRDLGAALGHPLPDGRVTWRWGAGRDPFTGDETHHRGVDLAAAAGTPVLAAAAGTVVVATTDWEASPSSGTVVVLDHGSGWSTVYTHLDRFEVSIDDRVAAGQTIGRVGSTGRSTGPHLHFEVRRDGEPVDPATVVDGM